LRPILVRGTNSSYQLANFIGEKKGREGREGDWMMLFPIFRRDRIHREVFNFVAVVERRHRGNKTSLKRRQNVEIWKAIIIILIIVIIIIIIIAPLSILSEDEWGSFRVPV